MREYFSENSGNLIKKYISMVIDTNQSATRGLLILPKITELLTQNFKFTILTDQSIYLHMSCLKISGEQNTFISHMLNTKGISIEKKILNKNDLLVICLSLFFLLNSQVDFISRIFNKT